MAATSPLRLLLIEDNPGDARYIRELLLEASELSVRVGARGPGTVETGVANEPSAPELHHETRLAAGLEWLDEEDIDAILLDLDLPDSEGIETLTTLTEHTDSPIIVLTGLRDRETGIEALQRGAEEYLVKDEINSDLLIRSVYHAIERWKHERELKRYETLIKASTDVNAILDLDGTIRYLTPSVERVLGYSPEELLHETVFDYVHPDDRSEAIAAFEGIVEKEGRRPPIELRVKHADGSWIILEVRSRSLLDDPLIDGIVVYSRDITERKRREQQIEQQRERLAALNNLNGVVRDITDAIIEQSTREEIEKIVCERLAAAESYLFAWIGEVDAQTREVVPRTESGAEGYLDEVTISVDPDDERSHGPTGKAILERKIQTVQDTRSDRRHEPWRRQITDHGFRSSAAIPLIYEDSIFGVLNVYADRPNAFADEERELLGQLGEIIGHAIAAIERKRALTSDEVVEVEFYVRDFFGQYDVPTVDGTVTFTRTIPVGDGEYLEYGRATKEAVSMLESAVERVPFWTEMDVISEELDHVTFKLRLSDASVLSTVASFGGSVHEAVIEDGDLNLVAHLPPGIDVRNVIEGVQSEYPEANVLARRQVTRSMDQSHRLQRTLVDELTDRQRTILEAAYFAGFFEWPRVSTGEEIADSLGIAPATFSQHMRTAENKLFGALFEEMHPSV